MFTRLGEFTVRRRKAVLVGSVLLLAVAGVLGGGVFSHLSGGGFNDPSADSTKAERALEDMFHTGSPNYVLLVDAAERSSDPTTPGVDTPAVTDAATQIEQKLHDDHR